MTKTRAKKRTVWVLEHNESVEEDGPDIFKLVHIFGTLERALDYAKKSHITLTKKCKDYYTQSEYYDDHDEDLTTTVYTLTKRTIL